MQHIDETKPGMSTSGPRGYGRRMVDLERYEYIGERGIAVTLDRRAHSRQQQAEAIREHARCEAAKAPPMSAETAEKVATLLSVRTPAHQLMRWRLRLYCGHVVERRAHADHRTIHAAFMSGSACEQCGLDPSTIVAARALGPVEAAPGQAPSPRLDRERIERRIEKLEAELGRLRADLAASNDTGQSGP